MAKPTGAIQVGGISPPDQFYDLASMLTQEELLYNTNKMYAYLVIPLPRWPSFLNDYGSSNIMGQITHGVHATVAADQSVKVTYMINSDNKTAQSAHEVVPETTPAVAAWTEVTGPEPIRYDQIDSGNAPDIRPKAVVIEIEMFWTDNDAGADTATVDGIYTEVSFGDYSDGEPGATVPRDSYLERTYAPGHFADAYMGMSVISDTINAYVAKSNLRMCTPIFGNTAE